MNRTLRKLKCALGMHEYRPERETCVCIRDDYHAATYRMGNKCMYCGKEYADIVTIPYRTR